jgi:peptidoglycan/LPS O-acetylase OafA/YrhL
MFRAAAVVFVLLGASILWRFALTAYQPQFRPYGLGFGVAALAIGVFLFRRASLAIGASAGVSAFIGICATVAAPNGHGPVILFFAALAIVCGTYAVLAARELGQRKQQGSSQ